MFQQQLFTLGSTAIAQDARKALSSQQGLPYSTQGKQKMIQAQFGIKSSRNGVPSLQMKSAFAENKKYGFAESSSNKYESVKTPSQQTPNQQIGLGLKLQMSKDQALLRGSNISMSLNANSNQNWTKNSVKKYKQVGDFSMSDFGTSLVLDDDHMTKEVSQKGKPRQQISAYPDQASNTDTAWYGDKHKDPHDRKHPPYAIKDINGSGKFYFQKDLKDEVKQEVSSKQKSTVSTGQAMNQIPSGYEKQGTKYAKIANTDTSWYGDKHKDPFQRSIPPYAIKDINNLAGKQMMPQPGQQQPQVSSGQAIAYWKAGSQSMPSNMQQQPINSGQTMDSAGQSTTVNTDTAWYGDKHKDPLQRSFPPYKIASPIPLPQVKSNDLQQQILTKFGVETSLEILSREAASSQQREIDDFEEPFKYVGPFRTDEKQLEQIQQNLEDRAFPIAQKELSYPMNGLEPIISEKALGIHFRQHYFEHILQLNHKYFEMVEFLVETNNPDALIPPHLDAGDPFNAGGHLNHELYWESLCPVKESKFPKKSSKLGKAINESFGSIDHMIEIFTKAEQQENGSGWAWLVYAQDKGTLEVKYTFDNDRIAQYEPSAVPLLVIDMWENAYINDYDERSQYLQNIWSIINWKKVADRYKKSIKQ